MVTCLQFFRHALEVVLGAGGARKNDARSAAWRRAGSFGADECWHLLVSACVAVHLDALKIARHIAASVVDAKNMVVDAKNAPMDLAPPFQVRSATVQHRRHGGVNGWGKGRGQGL